MQPYYQDHLVTLWHGNALDITEWQTATTLVCDPPYGVNWRGIISGHNKGYDKHAAGIANDKDTQARDDILELWGDRPAIVFGSWKQPRPANTKHRLIWHKQGMAPGAVNAPFMSQDEEIYILGRGFISTAPPQRSVITTTENRSLAVRDIGHPTPKPIGLMELLINRCPAGPIADPFAGSGSTLIAARNLNRQAIGVEINEAYCEIVAKRLSQQAFDLGGM